MGLDLSNLILLVFWAHHVNEEEVAKTVELAQERPAVLGLDWSFASYDRR